MYPYIPVSATCGYTEDKDAPCRAAQRLASDHSTSLSSSLSDLFPTNTVTRFGLASARASSNQRDKFTYELRLCSRLRFQYHSRDY